MHTITVRSGDKTLTAHAGTGTTLLKALTDASIFLDAPCGGNGTCGKCRVHANGALSPQSGDELKYLDGADMRLACYAKVEGDCEVTLPESCGIGAQQTGIMTAFTPDPAVGYMTLTLTKPDTENQISDFDNLRAAALDAGISLSSAAAGAIRSLPEVIRDGNFTVGITYYGDRLLTVTKEDRRLGLAVDIGTTTVVGYFYDLRDCSLITVKSGLNPQRMSGADVISRIDAQCEAGGTELLQGAVVGLLNRYIEEFCIEKRANAADIAAVTIAGNTTMQHLFAGIPARYIASAPFIPATLFGNALTAADTGLKLPPDTPIILTPCISAYVGGDITAGMLSSGFSAEKRPAVYIDIGTNGEMALNQNGRFVCCSTAAGPAFEGAHIHFGTGSIPGAISKVFIKDGEVGYETIGGAPAAGICGSGLIDALAVMLSLGILDETGRIDDEAPAAERYVKEDGDELIFVIDKTSGIGVTGKDVRQVQLAKSAICAGVLTMLDAAKIDTDELFRLYIAGGFGSHINPESAMRIGLIPKLPLDRIVVAGNAAGTGAALMLLKGSALDEQKRIVAGTEYIELSTSPFFQDAYIEQMMFE